VERVTAQLDRRWRRDARRALRRHLGIGAGPRRYVPGAGIVDGLQDSDLVVIEAEAASAWLVGTRSEPGRLVSDVFDRVTVIVAEAEVATAIGSYPEQIGVHALGYVAGRPALLPVRDASRQFAGEAGSLGALLWRDELAEILSSWGRPVPVLATRAVLLDQLLDCCPAYQVREKVLEYLLR
jgi:hypothetical protein